MKTMALAACLLFLQCGENSSGVPDSGLTLRDRTQGEFAYTGYDERGKEIVKGTLNIAVDDSNRVSGTWDLVLTDTTATMIGPQVGHGTLVGDVRLEGIGVNLNPDFVDNNVVLIGRWTTTGIAGKWQFIGFPGVLNEGPFIAVHAR